MRLPLQQLELTYTNWLPEDSMPQGTVLKSSEVVNHLSLPGVVARFVPVISASHYFLSNQGVPAGRLSLNTSGGAIRSLGVSVQSRSHMTISYFADLEPGLTDERLAEIVAFGRNAIVGTFDQVTTGPAT